MSASRVWVMATTMLCGIGANLVFAGPAEAAVTCGSERATIVGTQAGDTLTGTPGDDVIVGLGGSDTIDGRGGRDLICGNQDHDVLSGGPGRDLILGGLDGLGETEPAGVFCFGDWLWGGAGDDRLIPGFDPQGVGQKPCPGRVRDRLFWDTSPHRVRIDLARGVAVGQGHDTFPSTPVRVVGSDFNDQIDGSRRADAISAGLGSDQVRAGAGDDKIDADSSTSVREQPDNADLVIAGAGTDRIDALQGSDRLYGGDGKDLISSLSNGEGSDQTFGGPGRDSLIVQFAFTPDQVISGGPGFDAVNLDDFNTDPLTPQATGTFDMATGQMTYQIDTQQVDVAVPGFESLVLGAEGRPDTWQVRGTDGNDHLSAFNSDGITFEALGGNDVMWGSLGDDVYDGGPGDDTAHDMDQGTDVCRNVEHVLSSSATGAATRP